MDLQRNNAENSKNESWLVFFAHDVGLPKMAQQFLQMLDSFYSDVAVILEVAECAEVNFGRLCCNLSHR